MILGGRGGFR
jgi:hypothetical protein